MSTRALSFTFTTLLIAIFMLPAWSAAAARSEGGGAGLTSLAGLKGKDILGPDRSGPRLGIVEDVLIGADGSFTFLVLSRGSAFGVIGPFHLIPWRLAAPRVERDAVRIAFGEKVIEKSPALRMEAWPPASLAPGSVEQVRAYYRQAGQGKTFQRSSE